MSATVAMATTAADNKPAGAQNKAHLVTSKIGAFDNVNRRLFFFLTEGQKESGGRWWWGRGGLNCLAPRETNRILMNAGVDEREEGRRCAV